MRTKPSLKLYQENINLDLTLKEHQPISDVNLIVEQRVTLEKRTYSNRVYLMVLKFTMDKTIGQSIPKFASFKAFFYFIT